MHSGLLPIPSSVRSQLLKSQILSLLCTFVQPLIYVELIPIDNSKYKEVGTRICDHSKLADLQSTKTKSYVSVQFG